MDRDIAAQTLAKFGHSEAQVHPNMKLRAGNASAFLSGTWSAELAGLVEHSRSAGRKLSAGSAPGRKTTSRHYQLTLDTSTGAERCELSGSIVAIDEDANGEGGLLSLGTVTGTCSDSSLVLLVQWQEAKASTNTDPDDAAAAGKLSASLTGCTLLHAVYGHRLEKQFCVGDRVRIRPQEPDSSFDKAAELRGEIIESSAHSSSSGARKSDDSHGLAGTPQFLVQLDQRDHEDKHRHAALSLQSRVYSRVP